MKKIVSAALAAAMLMTMAVGCGEKKEEFQTVHLKIAADVASEEMLTEMISEFQEANKDKVELTYTLVDSEAATTKDGILRDPANAADIFLFYNDQFDDLYSGGVLQEVTEDAKDVIAAFGGEDSNAGQVSIRDGKLYAYPVAGGNGYFMYYNKAYLSETDVQQLDTILSTAAKNGKKFSMDMGGWYLYSFYKGAGLNLEYNDEKAANQCDWNTTSGAHTGVAVTQAILDITANDGFACIGDGDFVAGIEDGTIIAGISGAWNAGAVAAAWGDDYGAAKLPTYTLDGEQIQMCSFTGYKLLGVNSFGSNTKWAQRLAEFLTNEENQLKRFEEIGECPANVNAAHSEAVQVAPAVVALTDQEQYAYIQNVASPFWDPSAELGQILAEGNPDGRDLQDLLDEIVGRITKPAPVENKNG